MLAILSFLLRPSRPRLPLPPGPKGWPLIGNMLQIPTNDIWKFFGTETLEKYGTHHHDHVLSALEITRVSKTDSIWLESQGTLHTSRFLVVKSLYSTLTLLPTIFCSDVPQSTLIDLGYQWRESCTRSTRVSALNFVSLQHTFLRFV